MDVSSYVGTKSTGEVKILKTYQLQLKEDTS